MGALQGMRTNVTIIQTNICAHLYCNLLKGENNMLPNTARSALSPHVQGKRLRLVKKNWQLYLLCLLPIAWLVLFRYVPMLGIQMAFKKNFYQGSFWGTPWNTPLFAHFIKFFTMPRFQTALWNTLSLSLYGLLAGFPLPILLALTLNATRRNGVRRSVQFISYMPYFISTVVMVGILYLFTNYHLGIFNRLLVSLGGTKYNFMGESAAFRSLYVWSSVWQNMGYNSIIYIAALSSIDPELHEAARIDGANRFQRVLHIDLPGILPTVITLLILNAGMLMNMGFEKAYLMQTPQNLLTSEVISTYVYKTTLAANIPQYGLGTAIGLFNSVVNMALLLIVNFVAKRLGETSLF